MLVSVYIPTRNRLDKLKVAVDAVLNQTHRDIELIVVDEASVDGTGDWLRQLADSYARVVGFHHDTPRRAPVARNRAITAARGAFVTGCDDDDQFAPDRIERFLQFWKMTTQSGRPTSCLFSQEICAYAGGVTYATTKQGSVMVEDMCDGNQIGNQVFAPKHVFVDAGLFDESMPAWQDMEFWIRIIRMFGPARLVDLPLYMADVTPRGDRISADRGRVLAAHAKLCQIGFADQPRVQQRLMLQIFTNYYGFKPTLRDFLAFMKLGTWPWGLARLAKSRL